MDEDLWENSGLGHAAGAARGPSRRRQRVTARAHLGRQLRDWRQAHGLSQEQAHGRLGLSGMPSRMHLLELGEVPWVPEDVTALARALGLPPDELVREAAAAGDSEAARRRQEFVAWALTLPEGEWRAVVREVESERDGGGA